MMKRLMGSRRGWLAAMACAAVVMIGCEAKLTRANYDQIKNGMSLAEVQTLLGGSGTEDSSPAGMTVSGAGIAGTSKASNDKTYVWKENGVEIIVVFAEGKVVQFRQVGL